MTVSFDFDETLDRVDIQEYAKELLGRDSIDVIITTSRYDIDKHIEIFKPSPPYWYLINKDIYEIAESIGISDKNIIFTNDSYKYKYLNNRDVLWHLDDNPEELMLLMDYTDVKPVNSMNEDWKIICEKLIKNNDVNN